MIAVISCALSSQTASAYLLARLGELAEGATAALREVGFTTTLIDSATCERTVDELLDGADAVVVLGGADVTPSLYAAATVDPANYGSNRRADEFEIELTRRALEQERPFLGICRGMQLLNVALGGTLVQDLSDSAVHHRPRMEDGMTSHAVAVSEDSRLGTIFGTAIAAVQSGHHQAVDRLGSGLTVAARAADDVVEAIELPGRWVIGVQWHPEDADADRNDLTLLLRDLMAAATVHEASQPRSH